MPSTPLRSRPSQQHLNEQQTATHPSHPTHLASKQHALHRRDAPVNGTPVLPSFDPRIHGGKPRPSPAFSMNTAAHPVSDFPPVPSQLAEVPKFESNSSTSNRQRPTADDWPPQSMPSNGTYRPPEVDNASDGSSMASYDGHDVATRELPPLQAQSALDENDQMRPLSGDLLGSFDLVAPPDMSHQPFSLEIRTQQLFSRDHLQLVFSNPTLLLRFTAFLSTHRPGSVPVLIYYLDALKAIKAIKYSNAVAEALTPIQGHEFTASPLRPTVNPVLESTASAAFDALVEEDLPAYVTHMYIQIVSLSISQRITGTLAPHLREASEGLAECFVLTDVTRPDNPIVFASEGTRVNVYQIRVSS